MKFLLDFNLSLPAVVSALTQQGHEVLTAWEVNPKPHSDYDLVEQARALDATVIMIAYRPLPTDLQPPPAGLVLIRPFIGQTLKNVIARLTEHFRPVPADLPRLPFHKTDYGVSGTFWLK